MKKYLLTLVVLLALAILAAQCGQPQVIEKEVIVTKEVQVEKQVVVTPTPAPTGPVKLVVWSYLPESYPQLYPFWEEKTKEWQKTHPDVTVEFVSIPYDGSDAKYVATFAGRQNAPDIFMGKVPYHAGGLGVADPAPKELAEAWDKVAVDNIKDYLKYKGEWYGFPIETDLGMMLYYNTDMFKAAGLDPAKPPTTMDEFLEAAKKLTQYDASGEVAVAGFGVRYHGNPRGITDKWLPFLHAWGGRLYAEDESTADGYLNSKESIESLQFYGDLVNEYKVSSLTIGKPEDAICQKKAAMIFREAWMVGLIRDSCPDLQYGVASLPKKNAQPGLSLLFQDAVMVYKFSPYKELAWDWVKFMTTNEEYSLEMAKAMGNLPTHKALFEKDPYITQRPDYTAELAILNNPPSPYYGHPYINEISFRVGQAVEEVLFGMKDAETALNDAVPDVDEILLKQP